MNSITHKIKITSVTLILLLSSLFIKAQYDAMFTQYMFNEMFINPAYAGSKEALAVNMLHRQQWVDFPGRPITTSFTLHGPLMNDKMGVGLSLLNEKIGVLNRNLAYLSYAYRIKVGKKGKLSFGIMGGIHNQQSNLGQLKTTDANDNRFIQNSPNLIAPNFGGGIFYYTNKFYTGLSIPRLVHDNITFSSNEATTGSKITPSKFHYYFTVGRVFSLKDNLKFKTQAMLKAVENAPIQYDMNINFLINEFVWLGASYRSGADASAILGFQINPQFIVSYSYDYALTKIQKYSQGSHEIALGYVFGYKPKKIITPRYF